MTFALSSPRALGLQLCGRHCAAHLSERCLARYARCEPPRTSTHWPLDTATNANNRYIEVKATTTIDKHLFEMSYAEWRFAQVGTTVSNQMAIPAVWPSDPRQCAGCPPLRASWVSPLPAMDASQGYTPRSIFVGTLQVAADERRQLSCVSCLPSRL